jgi:hypothetical protein
MGNYKVLITFFFSFLFLSPYFILLLFHCHTNIHTLSNSHTMKIKTNSDLLASTTFTSLPVNTKLTKQQATPNVNTSQKPQRQTAAQRRAALLAQNVIIAKEQEPVTTTLVEPATTIISTPSPPLSSSSSITTEDEEHLTPPSSPSLDSPSVASLEANARILTVKRDGNLKAVMMEFATMKKQGLVLTHHTYNLVLDAYATLRREGSPLAPMLRGNTHTYIYKSSTRRLTLKPFSSPSFSLSLQCSLR